MELNRVVDKVRRIYLESRCEFVPGKHFMVVDVVRELRSSHQELYCHGAMNAHSIKIPFSFKNMSKYIVEK